MWILGGTKDVYGKGGDHTDDNQFYIAEITNYGKDVSGIDFNLGYHSGWSASWEIDKIGMSSANNIQLKDMWTLKELQALRVAKENLVGEIIMKTVQSGAVLGASYIAPEMAILVSLGNMAVNGSASTVMGLDSLTTNQLGKLGIKSGNIVTQNLINYLIQLDNITNKSNDKTYKTMMEWFGMGETYKINDEKGVAFAGFYDPEKLCALNQLQTKGLAAIFVNGRKMDWPVW